VSAAVLFPETGLFVSIVRWILRNHARDLQTMEPVVKSSGLQWTIVRPARLVHAPDTDFRAKVDGLPDGKQEVSFRAVAAALLDAIENGKYIGETVGLIR
jgi:uncharacterized protein YbjT (DUF2867 family)